MPARLQMPNGGTMWGLSTIQRINEETGDTARDEGTQPVILSSHDDVETLIPYPALGDDTDNVELEHLESLFCDSSGFGSPRERALTAEQLFEKLKEMIDEHGPIAVGTGEVGQFQLYLEVWKAA